MWYVLLGLWSYLASPATIGSAPCRTLIKRSDFTFQTPACTCCTRDAFCKAELKSPEWCIIFFLGIHCICFCTRCRNILEFVYSCKTHRLHCACMERIQLCVWGCMCAFYERLELLSAFLLHLNPSIPQLVADVGSREVQSACFSALFALSAHCFVLHIQQWETE